MMTDRLVKWDALELKLSATRLEPLMREKATEANAPVSDLRLAFREGLMTIRGKSKGFLTIPFEIEITEIRAEGKRVIVPISSISAAGFPVPKLLSSLFEKTAASGAVRVDGTGPTVTVLVDRFLPEFVDVELDEILIVEDGLLIRTGSGGADPPEGV